jgi:hypothetical protein
MYALNSAPGFSSLTWTSITMSVGAAEPVLPEWRYTKYARSTIQAANRGRDATRALGSIPGARRN